MNKRICGGIAAGAFLAGAVLLGGCQTNVGQADEDTKPPVQEGRQSCPARELCEYLNEEMPEAPYVYAQILIDTNAVSDTEEGHRVKGAVGFAAADTAGVSEDYAVNMPGTADILWERFETAEAFEAYLAVKEAEESAVFSEDTGYTIELSYYQYRLEEDTHALDMYHFLEARYHTEENPLYALTLTSGNAHRYDSYCFCQFGLREMVVKDDMFYALACRGIADDTKQEEIKKLLMRYSLQKQGIKEHSGWVMKEEDLYWVDHKERVTQFENPTRTFTEIRGTDETWGTSRNYMEHFAVLREADYQLALSAKGPLVRIHFSFTEAIPESGYKRYLWNGFCSDESYEMTVTDSETGELLQKRNIQMSIEMPDMITFTDLDADGYLDMQLDKPVHSSGQRAVMTEYARQIWLLWNPDEAVFELAGSEEIEQRRRQNQEENETLREEPDFVAYIVQPGDTLWGISRKFYGTGALYERIAQENAAVLSGYKYLMPGMRLEISLPLCLY